MLIERIQQAEKAYKDAMDQVKDTDLMDVFRPVFEENPGLESFSWNQYTPYFNDGETCRFSVHDIDEVNGNSEYSEEWEEQVYRGWGDNEVHGPLYNAYDSARKTLDKIPKALLEKVLGDHVRVTVTRDGISTEEHSHD